MRFIHVEDNPTDAGLIHSLIRRKWPDCVIQQVDNRRDLEELLAGPDPDLIISDFSLPQFDGLSALALAKQVKPSVPFIFLSGTIGEEVAVEALRNGATDYVIKDRMGRLLPAIERALLEADELKHRQAVEEELRASEERFRQITENVADLIAVLDVHGRRIYNNPAYEAVLGDTARLRGTMAFEEIHPEDRDRVRRLFQETVKTGVGKRAEFRFLLKDGTVRFIESQGSVIRDAQGEIVNVLVVSRDVTERRKAEERIREQASLLDQARDAIVVTDLQRHVTYWNAHAEEIFGWSRDEVMGRDVQELLFPEDEFDSHDICARLRADRRWQGELRPKTKNGSRLIVESRWTLVGDRGGTPKSVLLINTDVTEQRRIEAQFLRTQRMESIGTLAGGIAHDLNNVLTPILVAAQVLQSQRLPAETGDLLGTIERSAMHGASLVKQVLLFARGAAGERIPVQLRHLILDMSRLLRETLPRSIDVRTRVASDLHTVMGDPTQFSQVLMNLAINARDAMNGTGMLEIAARNIVVDDHFARMHPGIKAGDHVMISVRDSGCGIPPEIMERIFDPFFTTKSEGKGTGLGLSTVLGIVKGHGGVVHVTSEAGRGACFEVYLPAYEKSAPVPPSNSRAPIPRGHGEGVLVIDDEPIVREVFLSILRRFGYRTFEAGDGQKGAEIFRKNRQDIALTLVDMMMPGIDGRATVRLLRSIDPKARIMFVSGMLENDVVEVGSEFQDVELLRKPITADVLMERIAIALSSEPTGASR